MWVCLRIRKNIVVDGRMIHYQPGDWVNVGKQWAREWIASGAAYTIDPDDAARTFEPTAGILFRGTVGDAWREKLAQISGLQFAFGGEREVSLPFTETLIYKPDFELRLDLLVVGFNLLKTWQVAVPLLSYDTLAAQAGTDAEREQTQAVIRDLRVPLRDTRLMFVRRCGATRQLIERWQAGMVADGANEQLAFMRALYITKPLICDLPVEWTGRR